MYGRVASSNGRQNIGEDAAAHGEVAGVMEPAVLEERQPIGRSAIIPKYGTHSSTQWQGILTLGCITVLLYNVYSTTVIFLIKGSRETLSNKPHVQSCLVHW